MAWRAPMIPRKEDESQAGGDAEIEFLGQAGLSVLAASN